MFPAASLLFRCPQMQHSRPRYLIFHTILERFFFFLSISLFSIFLSLISQLQNVHQTVPAGQVLHSHAGASPLLGKPEQGCSSQGLTSYYEWKASFKRPCFPFVYQPRRMWVTFNASSTHSHLSSQSCFIFVFDIFCILKTFSYSCFYSLIRSTFSKNLNKLIT